VDRCKGDLIEDNADFQVCLSKHALHILNSDCTSLTIRGNPTSYTTGTLPTQLGMLTALTTLTLEALYNYQSGRYDNVNLTGTLPSELGALTNLVRLELDGNSLTGTIPSEWARMTRLRHM
jgi:hypothetical protein